MLDSNRFACPFRASPMIYMVPDPTTGMCVPSRSLGSTVGLGLGQTTLTQDFSQELLGGSPTALQTVLAIGGVIFAAGLVVRSVRKLGRRIGL